MVACSMPRIEKSIKIEPVTLIFSKKKDFFLILFFVNFWTFGLYFDVREHYHQTRNEKTRTGSYFHLIWLAGRPEQPKTTS